LLKATPAPVQLAAYRQVVRRISLEEAGMVSLRLVNSEDITRLVDISKQAFENDINYGAPKIGGPPGYDSKKWQSDTAAEATAYYVILEYDIIVGGLIVFGTDGDYWLGRIFQCAPMEFGNPSMEYSKSFIL
jgi:hypothetical protein